MILNPISKGGKGLLPEIIVIAPSGSTLDLMQGSVVLQTYTLSSTETQHTFTVKNTGTYTVRGTSGSDTKSVEVVVDATGQHSCTIEYFNGLKLYWYGDECEDVTGGWIKDWNSYSSSFTAEKNENSMYVSYSHVYQNNNDGGFVTVNEIDTSNYTKVCVELENVSGRFGIYVEMVVGTKPYSYDNSKTEAYCNGTTDTMIEKPVTDLDLTKGRLGVLAWAEKTFTIKSVWLE